MKDKIDAIFYLLMSILLGIFYVAMLINGETIFYRIVGFIVSLILLAFIIGSLITLFKKGENK